MRKRKESEPLVIPDVPAEIEVSHQVRMVTPGWRPYFTLGELEEFTKTTLREGFDQDCHVSVSSPNSSLSGRYYITAYRTDD